MTGTSPKLHHRTTLNLRPDQRRALRTILAKIEDARRVTLRQAQLLRGILDGVLRTDLDLTSARSEADVASLVERAIRRD